MLGLGMGIEETAVIRPHGGAFSPAGLFGASDEGVFYDPSNTSSLFQLSTGATAVTVGDPVGYVTDLSGNGNHAKQATAGNRPTLQQDAGGKYYLDGPGSSEHLLAALTAGVPQPSTMFAAYRFDAAGDQAIMDAGDAVATGSTRNFLGVLSGNLSIFAGTGVIGSTAENTTANHIVLVEFNGASGSVERDAVAAGSGNAGTGAPSTGHRLTLFVNVTAGGQLMNGRIYAAGYINRLLSAGEKTSLRAWLNAKAGL